MAEIRNLPPDEIVKMRYEKFRRLGTFDQI